MGMSRMMIFKGGLAALCCITLLPACQPEADGEVPEDVPQGGAAGLGGGRATSPDVAARKSGEDSSLSVALVDQLGSFDAFSSGQGSNFRPRCVLDPTSSTLSLSGTAGETSEVSFEASLLTSTAAVDGEYLGSVTAGELAVTLRKGQTSGSTFVFGSTASASSYCRIELAPKNAYLQGNLVCRDLLEQGAYGNQVGVSATIEVRCVLETVEETQAGTGGSSGSGGSPSTGGTSAGSGRCEGVAYGCSLLSDLECSQVTGCSMQGDCNGVSALCSYQNYSFECYALDGCSWSTYYDSCSGYSRSCSGYSGRSSCVGQEGCRWSERCEGVPSLCSSNATKFSCGEQPGCLWKE